MDGPRDSHTEWNKSDTERQIYGITYMWNLKVGTNELIYKAKIELQMYKINLWLPGGKGRGRDKLEDWNWHIHTAIYKRDN